MSKTIHAKALRISLAKVLRQVEKGERFTVIYRSHPICQLVPLGDEGRSLGKLEHDALYRAPPVGESRDGKRASDHDQLLYASKS